MTVGQNKRMSEPGRPRFPAWFVGLLIAIVVFVAALWVFSALGYGDDPVIDSSSYLVR